MQTFKEFRPTQFDVKGLGSEGREDWLILPVIQTRDSGPLERVNFDAALAMMGGESDIVEVHRFGHWGPGWFEIIAVHPSLEDKAQEIEDSLESYPVLDDAALSQAEWDEYLEAFDEREFERILERKFADDDETLDLIFDPGLNRAALMEAYQDSRTSGEYYIVESSGVYIPGRWIEAFCNGLSRDEVIALCFE